MRRKTRRRYLNGMESAAPTAQTKARPPRPPKPRRLAKIEFEGGSAVITQSADGEIAIHWRGGFARSQEMLRTFDIDHAANFIGGMVFSEYYGAD